MAGRPDGDEGDALAAPLELSQRGQTGPGGAPRRRPRVRPRVGVGVDVAAPVGAERREPGEVVAVMDPRQLVQGRLAEGRDHHLVLRPQRADAVHDGDQAGRPLGMAGAAVVLGRARTARRRRAPSPRDPPSPLRHGRTGWRGEHGLSSSICMLGARPPAARPAAHAARPSYAGAPWWPSCRRGWSTSPGRSTATRHPLVQVERPVPEPGPGRGPGARAAPAACAGRTST